MQQHPTTWHQLETMLQPGWQQQSMRTSNKKTVHFEAYGNTGNYYGFKGHNTKKGPTRELKGLQSTLPMTNTSTMANDNIVQPHVKNPSLPNHWRKWGWGSSPCIWLKPRGLVLYHQAELWPEKTQISMWCIEWHRHIILKGCHFWWNYEFSMVQCMEEGTNITDIWWGMQASVNGNVFNIEHEQDGIWRYKARIMTKGVHDDTWSRLHEILLPVTMEVGICTIVDIRASLLLPWTRICTVILCWHAVLWHVIPE